MEIAVVLLLLVLILADFVFEFVAIEVLSLLVMAMLVVVGILTPAEAFHGFASPVVVMVAGVMILTGGLIHNGAADMIARRIRASSNTPPVRTRLVLFGTVGALSTFINNVAATAMFIPVAEGLARRMAIHRGHLLLPVAFVSMLGGMCTLIGTSTNIAVSGALAERGLRPLGMFELAPIGLVVGVLGIAYLVWVAPRLLRRPEEPEPVTAYGVRRFLYEIVVHGNSSLAGRTLVEGRLGEVLGVNVLAIVRGERRILSPAGVERVEAGDLLLVEGETATIPVVRGRRGLEIRSFGSRQSADLESDRVKIVEATISYNSPFIGRTLKEIDFRNRFGLTVLAIHRRGEVVIEKVGRVRLRAGDVLLIHGPQDAFQRLGREPTLLLLESVILPRFHPRRALRGVLVMGGAVATTSLGWLDAPTSFLLGGALVMALGCLPPDAAVSHLNLRFLVMLAGMAALGTAMERSGAAVFLAEGLIELLGTRNPLMLVAVFFLLTVALTQPLSNAAAALLVMPIGLVSAQQAGVDPRSFAVAIAIAASCSFITPLEPACLLVYDTGRYRVTDFIRVGTPLTLIALLATLLLIPRLWPFHP